MISCFMQTAKGLITGIGIGAVIGLILGLTVIYKEDRTNSHKIWSIICNFIDAHWAKMIVGCICLFATTLLIGTILCYLTK